MRNVILILLVFCIQKGVAQNTSEDSNILLNKAFSHHYTHKDSAYFYYEKAITIADENDNLETLLNALLYLINANGFHYDLENYYKNIIREETYLNGDKRFDTLKQLNFYKDYLLFDKGNYHYKTKQYIKAKDYFLKLKNKIDLTPENQRTGNDLAMTSSLYSFLGLIYHHTGKYEQAEYTFKKDLDFLDKNKDKIADWKRRSINSKKLLAQSYQRMRKFGRANKLIDEVLSYLKDKKEDTSLKNNLLSTYRIFSKNYIEQKKYNKVIIALDELMQKNIGVSEFDKELDLMYGDAYLGLDKYNEANNYYSSSLKKTVAYRKGKHQDIAKVYARFGKLYTKQLNIEKALENYQNALIQLEHSFNNKDINFNPSPQKTISKLDLIRILNGKLAALEKAYEVSKDISYLSVAISTSRSIVQTLDVLRPVFDSKLDKEFLVNETYPFLQKTVGILFTLYNDTNDEKYIDEAFYFIEKSKSISLLEAHRNAEATVYAGISNKVVDEEQQYRATISHLEKKLFETKTDQEQSVKDTLFSIKKRYTDFVTSIEKKYPKYYALKYKSSVISTSDIKKALTNKEALLNFLVVESNIYLVLVDKKTSFFYKLNYNKKIKNSIKTFYKSAAKLNYKDTFIFNNSKIVYKAILEQALKDTKAIDLIIVPDDMLYYIPYDALLTKDDVRSFLIKTHAISYANSATLLQEQKNRVSKNKNNLVVFAPDFNDENVETLNGEVEASALMYSNIEAENITKYFDGKLFDKDNATLSNFRKEINNHNLIHFATHASANDEFPDYSYLIFSNDSINSNVLYAKDIYNYTTNADIITLSACETGIGKLQKGEGMLSLARAFNYAGASSIVNTLWKINDQSSKEIISNFYENLNDGLSKKEALRQAKLNYLMVNNDDPLLLHPYFWSGIIITGNTMPIVNTNYFWWYVLVGFIFLMIFLLRKKLLKIF